MSPIFKNVEVSRDDIGNHMKAYAEEKGIMSQPPKSQCRKYVLRKDHDNHPAIKMVFDQRTHRHAYLPGR